MCVQATTNTARVKTDLDLDTATFLHDVDGVLPKRLVGAATDVDTVSWPGQKMTKDTRKFVVHI